MKTFYILFAALLVQVAAHAQQTAQISSAEITFVYLSNDTDGSISGFSSSSVIDTVNPENSVFQGEVRTKTLKTGNFLRDWSLKGSKYFDVDSFPSIKFKSTSVVTDEAGYTVVGNLTIKNITKSVTMEFTRNGNQLIGTTTLFSSDYGIHVKKKKEDNKVSVRLAFSLK